jgi:Protein of unknown function (DUF3606)
MTDKTRWEPPEADYISLVDEFEIAYWRRVLGVSEERLVELVRQHGNSAKRVREAVGRTTAPSRS